MRILSISGQNIASLAAPFRIDFTTAPLAGAGLFAITGETGAGKSSILDAMCLALYGDAPRLSAGARSDKVPDAAGEEISAADSRAILRRGAATGWAEVRFAGRDGLEYIARWQARRARDKVEGKLQTVARSLARAEDGQVLAAQTQAVSEQVAALTGLSYDEFRRTVLLAQGDFDAFLRADTGERATLLEKVTGTGLYRAVSIRVYERTEMARAEHAQLLARAAEHRLLDDAARAALTEEIAARTAATAAATAERAGLSEALARHRRHAEAVRQVQAAAAALAGAEARQAEAGPARAQLDRLERAAPLHLPWQAAAEARARLDAARSGAEAAAASRSLAAQALATRADAAARATAAGTETEEAFKAFGRIWDRAAALDAQIATAATEAEAARTRAAETARAAAETRRAEADLAATETRAQQARQAAEARLAELAAQAPLADDWPQLRRDLADHRAACAAQAAAATAAQAAQDRAQALAQEARAAAAAEARDQAADSALAQAAAALQQALAPLEAAHPPARTADLARIETDLAELARALRDGAEAAALGAAAQRAATAAATEAALARAQESAAKQDLDRAEAQIAALTAPLEQADLALSDAARSLRAQLSAGSPCPVCGALEHPTPAEAGLAHLAARLRADQAAARGAAQAARDALTAAQGARATAEARGTQAAEDQRRAQTRAEAARAAWSDTQARVSARPLAPALPGTPDPTALAAAQDRLCALQTAEAAAQAEISALRTRLTEAERDRERLRRALLAHRGTRERLAVQQAETAQEAALAEARRTEAAARRDGLARALAPALARAGEDDPAAPGLAERLAATVSAVGAARTGLQAAQEALSALAPQLAAARRDSETATAQAQSAAQAARDRDAAWAALRAERAPLLDGQPTALHRSRFNDQRLAAQRAQQAAAADLATAQAALAAAEARAAETARAASEAATAQRAAEAGLAAALEAAAMSAAELAALIALPPGTAERLRADLRGRDDAVTAARSALGARKTDLQEIEDQGNPAEDPEALSARLAALEAEAERRAQEIGQLSAELARDAATRAALAGLAVETEAARAELEVWEAVNKAIGARSGDRFARIAQAITLDVLVEHANRHLADLNPRYRLRRAAELSLQVEDRDMGDTARATRSLSGGERFLVSLALALALSQMGGKGTFAGTLFIDEGFGALDAGSLDLAIDALETLQSQGRQVGVISHVEAMQARIATRIAVRKEGGGRSSLRVEGPGV
ncbi:AAA family ATPase [Rhodobacter capsulatus]|uniref:AAA family ATPase n=1 Tax=Rhodobacter capsulatus TaxID=1061 RepID=UPI0003D2F7EC|nr:AAA family ATPase [Rhodobacter capsulatus]ETD81263.1 nuclease SbcCD subunit C [Rhodobacter capsulatus YW1]